MDAGNILAPMQISCLYTVVANPIRIIIILIISDSISSILTTIPWLLRHLSVISYQGHCCLNAGRSHAVKYTQYSIYPTRNPPQQHFYIMILGFQPIDCSSGLGLDNCMVKRLTSTLRTNKPLNKFLHLVSFHRLNPPKESQFLYRHWWPTGQLLSLPQDIPIWSWINWNTKAFGRNIQRRPASIGMQSLHRLDFWCHEIFSPNPNTNCCIKFPNKKRLRKWFFWGGSPILRQQLFLTHMVGWAWGRFNVWDHTSL